MRIILVALFALALGCASKPKETNLADFAPLEKSDQPIFPYGRYLHHVSLHITRTETGKPANFDFEGVAQTSADALHLILLSPFHTTLMKIDEARATGKVTFEIYEDRIRKYQDKFAGYYGVLRKIVLMKKGANEFEVADPAGSSNVKLDNYVGGVPRHISIENPNYTLKIDVEPLT